MSQFIQVSPHIRERKLRDEIICQQQKILSQKTNLGSYVPLKMGALKSLSNPHKMGDIYDIHNTYTIYTYLYDIHRSVYIIYKR